MDVGAAELLGAHLLAGRRLHERRSTEEDRPGSAHDHGLVAHRRHVGASGRAGAHDDGDLGDALGRHPGLVEEDTAEVIAVRKDLVLHRQERASGVHEVDARQAVLLGHFLRPQVLLHRERVVGAALDGCVVGDDHALDALDDADAGDQAGPWSYAAVLLPGGERVQLEECRAGIEQPLDSLTREQLAARTMALDGLRRALGRDLLRPLPKLPDQRLHPLPVGGVLRRSAVRPGIEDGHYGLGGSLAMIALSFRRMSASSCPKSSR